MNLAERIEAWARGEASVEAVVLIGSQARAPEDEVWRPDPQSDWDFQIITSRPELLANAAWTAGLGVTLRTYAVRRAAIGGVPKVAALFEGAEADFVVIPASSLRLARWLVGLGVHRRSERLRRGLQDLAVVVRPGWRFLKGAEAWEPFYRRVVTEIADPRLGDDEIRGLADAFVCDVVWTRRKIERGELIAAQRMLHRSLAETNLRLLHELRLRRGERTFPEGRRAERILPESERARIAVTARLDAAELAAELARCAAACRDLTSALVGAAWRWPEGV